jgi:hypothetical protein
MGSDTTALDDVLDAVGDALRTAYDRLAGDDEAATHGQTPPETEGGVPERAEGPFGPNPDRTTWVERLRERLDEEERDGDRAPEGETR